MNSLGIDVGGANLKVASSKGCEIIYFPMWKKADELEKVLRSIARKYDATRAGVVMTAELADVFETKKEGVERVADTCRKVFDEVYFLNVYGELKSEIDDPLSFAASNWVASVTFLMSEGWRDFLFVDVGSTTADVIPVTDKIEAAITDFERLKREELIYFGILRTPVFYVLESFDSAPLCPEFFAITADVFRVTGDISEADYSCDTPDGKGKDVESCLRRLARTVCCDLNELGAEKTVQLAREAKASMVKKLATVISKKVKEYKLKVVLACGIGEFLVEESSECVKLSSLFGEYSKLFPAYAMLKLVEKK